jgi:thiol-disulfide isomerase/thioredoxin
MAATSLFLFLRRLLPVALALAATSCAFAADETGQPAPRFRAKTTAGDQFNNASTKGKVVLFEFWTTWCKYCEEEAALVDTVAKEFSGKGLIVLAVDVLEPDQKVKKYLAEHPRSVPIVLTKDTNLVAMYQANSYPIYVVIDRDGNIAGEQRGGEEQVSPLRSLGSAPVEMTRPNLSRAPLLNIPACNLFFDRGRHVREFRCVFVALIVDEEGWRSIHPAAHAAHEIGLDPGQVLMAFQRSLQFLGRHSDLGGQLFQERNAETALTFKDAVVHFPEMPCRSREFSRLRRGFRKRMNFGQRKIAEDKSQLLAEMLL